MADGCHHVPRKDLRIAHHVGDGSDSTARDFGIPQQGDPVDEPPAGEQLRKQRLQQLIVRDAPCVRREAFVAAKRAEAIRR